MQQILELTRPNLLFHRRELIERRREIDQRLRNVEELLVNLDRPPPLTDMIVENLRSGPKTAAEIRSHLMVDDDAAALSRAISKLVKSGRVTRSGHQYFLA